MINQLKELLQMQKELDERILQGKPYPVEKNENCFICGTWGNDAGITVIFQALEKECC